MTKWLKNGIIGIIKLNVIPVILRLTIYAMSEGRASHGQIKAGLERAAHLQDVHKSVGVNTNKESVKGGTAHVELSETDMEEAEQMLEEMQSVEDKRDQRAA